MNSKMETVVGEEGFVSPSKSMAEAELYSPVLNMAGAKLKHRNLTGTERQVKDSVADIHNTALKWNKMNAEGMEIIMKIANKKLEAIFKTEVKDASESSLSITQSMSMPVELNPLCDELWRIYLSMEKLVEKFESITEVIKCVRHLEEHRNKDGTATKIPFLTWTYLDFETTTRDLYLLFSKELSLKKAIVENIAHVTNRNLMMFCSVSWMYQPYTGNNTKMLVKKLVVMTGKDQDRMLRYPYTIGAKFFQFPWKYYWKNGRFVRYLTYSLILCFPLIYKIHKTVHSPENIRKWDEIRRKRDHTHFDPPHY